MDPAGGANGTKLFRRSIGKNGGTMTTHPMHLFDLDQKGPTGKPARLVRLTPTTWNDVSLNALLDAPTTKNARRSPLEWAAATGLHIVLVATLIIVPLYTTGTIPLSKYQDTLLLAPPARPHPPPPAPQRAPSPHITHTRPTLP